jgi:outer membrane protein OmpA-like peptidoglycan-associated protein
MDVQEKKLRDQLAGTGVSVTRVGDEIVLNMPGNLTFDTNSSAIKSNFYPVLNSVALVVKEYEKTIIEVTGHTDSTGTAEYNQTLSEKRASSVGDYIQGQGILATRVLTQGFGQNMPVADNGTPSGREQNRRVELRLVPLTA